MPVWTNKQDFKLLDTLKHIFGSRNDRLIRGYGRYIRAAKELEPGLKALSDEALRAKTEERHLSLDPVYVEYARWVDENGILRWMKHVPVLRTLVQWRPTFAGATDIAARAYGP